MLDFQRYQLAFTAHIRNPKKNPKPERVAEKRMAVYRECTFNNVVESVSACFPVCQNVLDKRKWQQLMRQFFANHSADTPLFREIPQQFLAFLGTIDLAETGLPQFIQQLAHYEWIELAISTRHVPQNVEDSINELNCLEAVIALAPASELLTYDFPVHEISARHKPTSIETTHYMVFRNKQFEVKFIVLNPVTFRLLSLIQQMPLTGKQALKKLAQDLTHFDEEKFIQFGIEILNDLQQQQAIVKQIHTA